MSTHVGDEIPLMLIGEADRETVVRAAAHLRTCADCQQELVSAVVAHAALSSANRFARDIVVADVPDDLAELDGLEPPTALPDLGPVLDRVRQESQHSGLTDLAQARHRRSARPRARTWLAAAAAVVVLGGGGTAVTLALTSSSSSPAGQSVALASYPAVNGPTATARMVGDHVSIDASSLPALGFGRDYEVWLTDAGRTSMTAIGYLDPNRTADFDVPPSWVARYSDIEISVQHYNDPRYSGDSVVRGSYA